MISLSFLMLGCGVIFARNPRNFGGPILTIVGMTLMNPWRGNERGLIFPSDALFSCNKRQEPRAYMSCFAASIYSLGGDVSARVSKETPIPACPISSRETRDIQTSMSSSAGPPHNRVTKVSSSYSPSQLRFSHFVASEPTRRVTSQKIGITARIRCMEKAALMTRRCLLCAIPREDAQMRQVLAPARVAFYRWRIAGQGPKATCSSWDQ